MNFLIVDDHYLARVGLTSLLESEGHCVIGNCSTGESAVHEVIRLKPDVVLLDIRLPDISGLEVLGHIKEHSPQMKVVIVTIAEDENYILEAIRNGEDGFLLKSSCSDEFINCVKALEQGNLALSPCLATRIIQDLMQAPEPPDDPNQELTERQVEILHLMALGWSNKEIGHKLMVSENTIKYHLKKILQKMNAQNRTEAVAMAVNNGLFEPILPVPS